MVLDKITDKEIIEYFYNKYDRINGNKLNIFLKNKEPINIYNYLINKYSDSLSIKETIIRIRRNIDIHPKCPICGKPVIFLGKIKRMFLETCSLECGYKYRQLENEIYWQKKEGINNAFASKENINKIKQTKLERYGDENYHNIEQMKKTCLEKYGIENGGGSKQAIDKIKEIWNNKSNIEKQNIILKSKQTRLKRYGNENYVNIEKSKQTCLNKYGVECYLCLNKGKKYDINRKNKISQITLSKEFQEKRYNTMKRNNSFIKSKLEENVYLELLNYFNKDDILRQYKSDLYPWRCDFYIQSIDTYIEVQGSQFHHFHPFNENNDEDLNELNKLISLSNNHKQYKSIIKTWTIYDVQKRNKAKENNLKYIEIFPKDNYKLIIKLLINEKNN